MEESWEKLVARLEKDVKWTDVIVERRFRTGGGTARGTGGNVIPLQMETGKDPEKMKYPLLLAGSALRARKHGCVIGVCNRGVVG